MPAFAKPQPHGQPDSQRPGFQPQPIPQHHAPAAVTDVYSYPDRDAVAWRHEHRADTDQHQHANQLTHHLSDRFTKHTTKHTTESQPAPLPFNKSDGQPPTVEPALIEVAIGESLVDTQ